MIHKLEILAEKAQGHESQIILMEAIVYIEKLEAENTRLNRERSLLSKNYALLQENIKLLNEKYDSLYALVNNTAEML